MKTAGVILVCLFALVLVLWFVGWRLGAGLLSWFEFSDAWKRRWK